MGLEPMAVMTAYKPWQDDPGAEVLAIYPDAKIDETKAAAWAGTWAENWNRRFGGPQ